MTRLSRAMVAAAALLLLSLFALPLWHIALEAPQYPEGLGMYIRVNTIEGANEFDLTKINNLNHYIGMRPIVPDAIAELRYMPWIVGGLAAAGLLAAAVGRRRGLVAWLAAFALFGAAGLADFYRWGHEYGHNLDPETAIIKVPGMTYQPPLIGSKQLLNFRATSWPAAGGWAAAASFAIGVAALLVASRAARRGRRDGLTSASAARTAAAAAATLAVVTACAAGAGGGGGSPPALRYDGTEVCDYCRMAVTDARFGAALVTRTGKVHRFDSVECLASFYAQARAAGTVGSVWVSDFRTPGSLVAAERARFVRGGGPGGSPMGLGLRAFDPAVDEAALRREYGETLGWDEVVALVERERSRLDDRARTAARAQDERAPDRETITVSPAGAVRTVGEAVRLARAGARIVVAAGVYREPTVLVDKPLEIVGEGWPVLDGEGAREILRVAADDVTVRGLVLRNVGTSFIEDRAAVRVTKARGCAIEDNRIEDAFFGIYLAAVADCRVAGNVLRGAGATESSSGNGIHLWSSAGVTIEGNHIAGHRDGIYLEFVTGSLVRGNVSERNLRYGLHFMYSDDCRYLDNVFRRNLAGVAVMYTKRIEMVGNRFEHNWGSASYGLLLKEISDPRIERNRFERNTVGLLADGAARIVAADNDFDGNGWAVKLMASTYDGRFERNDFAGNTFDVASNSRQSSGNRFAGNYFDAYRGYDLDRDGVGDVPHRPVRLFSVLVEQNEPALVLLRSFFVDLLDVAERVAPALTPAALADERPAMRPLHGGHRR